MANNTVGGLKKILVASSDFGDIAEYFLTLSETNGAAIEGKIGKNKNLLSVITVTVSEICKVQNLFDDLTTVNITGLRMIEVRERNFWHGAGFVNAKNIFTFLYFTDLDKGMVSITGTRGKIFFARISIQAVLSDKNPLEDFSQN